MLLSVVTYTSQTFPGSWFRAGGTRPVLILQNDIGNRFSPTVIVAAITAQIQKAKLPTHVEINAKSTDSSGIPSFY